MFLSHNSFYNLFSNNVFIFMLLGVTLATAVYLYLRPHPPSREQAFAKFKKVAGVEQQKSKRNVREKVSGGTAQQQTQRREVALQ